ncbi:MAG TPA: plastocyanin/azurin family copper-binding protein [Longimicrobium sp.]|nr:plastocyanin/azurin family copper-binding protein [Longimicrobium sp.]
MRIMNKLSLLGFAAMLAACGGGDKPAENADTTGGGAAAPAVEAPVAEAPAAPAAAPAAQGNVITVQMVTSPDGASGHFEPANVTVKKGDTVRFVNDGKAAHNVSFPPAENAGKSNLPPASPYVTAAGATYELVVNMDAGTYNFQCDPHATMGMKGVLTVQ